MRVHLLVGLDVAGDAQQLDVADIVGQPLHLLLSLCRLYGLDVVAVHAGTDESLAAASLAKSTSSLPDKSLHLGPALAVQ